jgi:hypothetical protein
VEERKGGRKEGWEKGRAEERKGGRKEGRKKGRAEEGSKNQMVVP